MPTAADFRYSNVLPNPLIDEYAGKQIKAIRFLEGFDSERKWWRFERYVEIDFNDPSNSDTERIASTCGACGLCCKDIPTHQIAIYISQKELDLANDAGLLVDVQGSVEIEGTVFYVIDVKENGDCSMLGPKGCTMGKHKPLWCAIYHCEKYQNRPYQFEVPK